MQNETTTNANQVTDIFRENYEQETPEEKKNANKV